MGRFPDGILPKVLSRLYRYLQGEEGRRMRSGTLLLIPLVFNTGLSGSQTTVIRYSPPPRGATFRNSEAGIARVRHLRCWCGNRIKSYHDVTMRFLVSRHAGPPTAEYTVL